MRISDWSSDVCSSDLSLFNSASALYSLAASLTQPIFDGGRLAGQVDLTEAQHQELVQTYVQTVLAAFGDVADALIVLQQAEARPAAPLEAVAAAAQAFRLFAAQYRTAADHPLPCSSPHQTQYPTPTQHGTQ